MQGAPSVVRLTTDDGVDIAVHRLGDPRATPVVLVPGTFSNHTFWLGTRGTGFARAAAAAGFEAWCLDPRGHGESERPGRKRRWDFDDWARYDLPSTLRAATADGRRAIVIGHSAGGAAAFACLAAHPELHDAVRGIAALATPVPWQQRIFSGIAGRAIRMASRHLHTFPARMLRLGPEDELAGVMEQWMGWNFDGRWLGDDGTDYGRLAASLRTPALVVAGTGDRIWAPPPAVLGLYDLIGSDPKEYLLCGIATGFQRDYGHVDLVVSRDARAEVWPRIIKWMQGGTRG